VTFKLVDFVCRPTQFELQGSHFRLHRKDALASRMRMKRIWSGMDVCRQTSFIAGTILTLVDFLWYIMVPNANSSVMVLFLRLHRIS